MRLLIAATITIVILLTIGYALAGEPTSSTPCDVPWADQNQLQCP